ncbi:MAG: response regulator [Candidatus Cloacimonetes bacterium]|nr:response regulator [Candidatus Cloacimonadota bacterium]
MKKLPISILCVEDEHIILQSLKDMLEDKVRNLYLAMNAKEALELFKKHKPDLVITDIKMPGMDGLELLRKVKKNEKRYQTGDPNRIWETELSHGCDHYWCG